MIQETPHLSYLSRDLWTSEENKSKKRQRTQTLGGWLEQKDNRETDMKNKHILKRRSNNVDVGR